MAMSWFCQRCLKDLDGEPGLDLESGMSLCPICLKDKEDVCQ